GRLVDLPTIIESQKSIDNRRFVKVADVTQMLVVDGPADLAAQSPDGITPPLNQVRQRRFRKRLSKQTIEQVEEEVERLLLADALAEEVEYGKLERDEYADEDEEDLARKLAQGFAELKEMDEDDEAGNEEEEDDDGDEVSVKRRALLQEMSSLTESIDRKESDLAKATNPIVKRRFEDIVSRLRVELESKKAQLDEL
ncbi:hypothetical protein BJ684DRAFT_3823, partial [Piptocephalis cylindrospora]